MKELERTLKALANKRRLSIVRHLKKRKEATVTELSYVINLSFRSTSRHLGILFAAGILERRQLSTKVRYFLTPKLNESAKHILSLL